MTDAADEPESARAVDTGSVDEASGDEAAVGGAAGGDASDDSIEALRAEVEEKYDFDDFGPADMAEMTAAEWDAAFDPDAWITGRDLLDRVERDLRSQIASREVFAVLERRNDPLSVVAYSDEGWAVVYEDGSVEGEGTVLRDVKPTVALCSMDSYEVRDPPAEYELPTPEEVESGTGEFGNLMIQVVAAMQILGGLGLFVAWLFLGVETLVAPVMGGFFLLVGVLLFGLVANARLSDRFRAEEYRDRLRAAGITDPGDDAEFVPFEEVAEEALAAARGEEPDPPDTTVPPGNDAGASVEASSDGAGTDPSTGTTEDETDG
ncbi:DUF7319 domain-containing protein [Halobaculum roseum]|uniref:DUF7319 domain-containing protein n=1 Tax=Halobaculum roseum TaxID=2175149 RepID=A0ABD5MFP5_9EURY|nr:hypothetical protein [Halobaculum roseum]QZY02357.1 hypothetical protein K6T36_13810 [Halobaculum roseum]